MTESYYSSDDEIAWGPLTLREIKKELEKSPRKIERRKSDSDLYKFYTPFTTFCEEKSQEIEDNKLNSSGATSAYFTPDDSLFQQVSNKNEVFLENLAKVIESDNCETIESVSSFEKSDNLVEILEAETGKDCNVLDDIQQTLIENTKCLSLLNTISCDSDDSTRDEEVDSDVQEVIVISDESTFDFENDSVFEDSPRKVKEENLSGNDEDSSLLEIEEKTDTLENSEEKKLSLSETEDKNLSPFETEKNEDKATHAFEENGEENNLSYLPEIEENEDKTTHAFEESVEENDLSYLPEIEESHPTNTEISDKNEKKNLNISYEHEEKDHSNNSSYFLNDTMEVIERAEIEKDHSRDSSFFLNDTIEEMERALREGLDYVMPEDSQISSKSSSSSHSPKSLKPTGIPMLKKKRQTPNKFDYVQSPVGDYIRKNPPHQDKFKLPQKPIKMKATTPKTLTQPKYLQNVQSPIGVYIKNSPGFYLKQNVAVKTVPNLNLPLKNEHVIDNKENTFVLPEVVYRPGRQVVTSTSQNVQLPSSIQKMVTQPVVTRHETRICARKCSPSRKLQEVDLTLVDSSVLNQSEEDISFVNVKHAYIK